MVYFISILRLVSAYGTVPDADILYICMSYVRIETGVYICLNPNLFIVSIRPCSYVYMFQVHSCAHMQTST